MNQSSGHCHFHPNEIFVGVCPLCLNERLVTFASMKQSHYNKHRTQQHLTSRGHSFGLTKKLLGLNLLDLRNHKTCNSFYGDREYYSSSSREGDSFADSFISIKFEENGAAFWDKENKTEIDKDSSKQRHKTKHLNLLVESNVSKTSNKTLNTGVTEDSKPQGGTQRWRKRIVHIFDHIRWKTVSNTNINMAH